MTLYIQINRQDADGNDVVYELTWNAYHEQEWLKALLEAKNNGKSIIIKNRLIDTAYVVSAYVE